jgi:hypothetical protein
MSRESSKVVRLIWYHYRSRESTEGWPSNALQAHVWYDAGKTFVGIRFVNVPWRRDLRRGLEHPEIIDASSSLIVSFSIHTDALCLPIGTPITQRDAMLVRSCWMLAVSLILYRSYLSIRIQPVRSKPEPKSGNWESEEQGKRQTDM